MTEEGAIMAYEMVEKQTHIPDVILLLLQVSMKAWQGSLPDG